MFFCQRMQGVLCISASRYASRQLTDIFALFVIDRVKLGNRKRKQRKSWEKLYYMHGTKYSYCSRSISKQNFSCFFERAPNKHEIGSDSKEVIACDKKLNKYDEDIGIKIMNSPTKLYIFLSLSPSLSGMENARREIAFLADAITAYPLVWNAEEHGWRTNVKIEYKVCYNKKTLRML